MRRIVETIIGSEIRTLSVIGLAKNTGKTVTLNALAAEAYRAGLRTAVVSFGRDGESVDAITRLDKPKIRVHPGSYFVTARRFLNPELVDVSRDEGTGVGTVFGEARIYRGGDAGGTAELIGINTVTNLKHTVTLLKNRADLVLVDGALDRRSSAVPLLSDACVLSTGAVLGRDESAVIRYTDQAMRRLLVPAVKDDTVAAAAGTIFAEGLHGIVYPDGTTVASADLPETIARFIRDPAASALIVNGALTDRRITPLLDRLDRGTSSVIVKDATRLFLDGNTMKTADRRGVRISVLDAVRVVALTVNPTRPYGSDMDSRRLVEALRERYPGILAFDVMKPDC